MTRAQSECEDPRPAEKPSPDWPIHCEVCGARRQASGSTPCSVCGEPVLVWEWAP